MSERGVGRPAAGAQPMNRLVHRVLVAGLVISATLLAVGLVVWAIRQGSLPHKSTGPVQAIRDIAALRANGFFSLGLLTLIATPFVRVAGSVLEFLHERDRRYAVITATVLAIMIASIFVGRL